MGQCSTLPTEGRTARSARRSDSSYRGEESVSSRGIKDKGSITGKRNPPQVQTQSQAQMEDQTRNPESMSGFEPMDEDGARDPIPQPPEIAVRTRCYKLNLDSDLLPQANAFLGPYTEVPPPLTYSSSEDSVDRTPTQIAIQTAKIFRGITVAKDGTILTQNARATRSNRGQKNKKGEKSRQAAKIEQAKDLVEETILTGKAPGSDEPANMVSLVPMGEYDDIKHLVRDGSKKLREAAELGDETLLAINRSRVTSPRPSMTSPRKRVSPSFTAGQRTTSSKSRIISQSTPPKLQGHPRDRPSTRRLDNKNRFGHGFDDEASRGRGIDGDWGSFSRGFHSIWNCGGNGEDMSTSSPHHGNFRPAFDGRVDNGYVHPREGAVATRAN